LLPFQFQESVEKFTECEIQPVSDASTTRKVCISVLLALAFAYHFSKP